MAEDYLLDWELNGEGVDRISKIYFYMEEFKQQDIKRRWEEILDLVEMKDFEKA